jgi:hypothetical protein
VYVCASGASGGINANDKCLKEGRISECFQTFDSATLATSQDFHIQHLFEFYRTAAELRLSVNRYMLYRVSDNIGNNLEKQLPTLRS